jgi:hypothetical protein
MRPQNRGVKRQQGRQEQEPEIDDLVVAASFAHAHVSTFSTAPNESPAEDVVTSTSDSESSVKNKLESVDDEASREKDDDSESDNVSIEHNNSIDNEGAARENDEEHSDDESDVDLKEALERMQDDEDDDDAGKSKKGNSQAPTTENELDPYRTPLEDLEQEFQLNLTVEEQERLRLTTKGTVSSLGKLCEAGNVRCHMIMDRTIVVESIATGGSAPLDEESILVIRVQEGGDARLLPLGKVFEVFGPVSRPLYTIRLPPARKKEAKKETKVNNYSVERDADEISLNDDEEDVKQVQVLSQEAETTKEGSSAEGDKSIATSAAASPNSDEVKIHDGTNGDVSVNDIESDPWAPEGNYTKLLQSTQGMTVYYIPDIARLLDTGAIIRNSGRGCGKLIRVTCLSFSVPFDWALTVLVATFHRCVQSIRRRSGQCKRDGI